MQNLEEIFSRNGPLARAVPGFRRRDQQVAMARAIAETMESCGVLVAEAGTGTGKTFAYLVPAMLSAGKVIVSTGTRTLQDQLFTRDVPTVRDALGAGVSVALLKGRANYVCHHHLQRALQDGRFLSRDAVIHLHLVERYARESGSGDRSGLTDVPEDSPVWPAVTSTRENCLGSECAHYKDCFVMGARKRALESDLVIVNHHLFFADVVLRDEGLAELLPACNTVIFDEAHQLPETASLFFGESVSTFQLIELARDIRTEALVSARDFTLLPEAADAMEKAARDLRLAVPRESARFTLTAGKASADFAAALEKLRGRLEALQEMLETQAPRSAELHHCWERGALLEQRVANWMADSPDERVRWAEVFSQAVVLNATPLSVAEIFGRQIEGTPRAWIFTSATLSVRGDFKLYCGEMGLVDAMTASWESPFDYERQGLLYVPEGMPDPNSDGYTEAVVRAALPVLRASRGRAFLLCTSLRAMARVHARLEAAFKEQGLDHPILVQGQGPRSELLARFRELGNAVLIGSQTFWEGVDVRGPALSVVVIDRLPFAAPDDPVLAARIEKMSREGRNAFMDYQLPRAIITLKQGAGRLIRDEGDTGVLMICDPRLVTKSYGRRVWQSLPPMRRTRDPSDVVAFLEAEPVAAA